MSQKSLFLYSKDLIVSHVYRHLSLFKSVWKPKKRPNPLKKIIFCQGIWSFLMFIDTFRIQDILSFLLFIDTTFQKVSRNSKTTKSLEIMTFQGVWSFLLFLDTFRIQGILSFLLFLDTFGKGWKVNKLYYKGCKV